MRLIEIIKTRGATLIYTNCRMNNDEFLLILFKTYLLKTYTTRFIYFGIILG